jgi:DNA-binding beta-propeller fold protein YncE
MYPFFPDILRASLRPCRRASRRAPHPPRSGLRLAAGRAVRLAAASLAAAFFASTLLAEVPADYPAWTLSQGLFGAGSQPEEAPAGDAVPNLLKYAAGLPALTPAFSSDLFDFTLDHDAQAIDLTFRRSPSATGVVLTPEWAWSPEGPWYAAGFGLEFRGVEGDREVWDTSLPFDGGGFFRLRAGVPDETLRPRFRSPFDLAYSPGGQTLAITDPECGVLYLLGTAGPLLGEQRSVVLHGRPSGLVWTAPDRLLVAEYGVGTVAEVDASLEQPHVVRRLRAGAMPYGVALAPESGLVVVSDFGRSEVRALDLATGLELGRVAVSRNPGFVAVTPDESLAVVANTLPAGAADDLVTAAEVALIDLDEFVVTARVPLPHGSTNVRQLRVSPDGRWAYVVHTIGVVVLPAIKLDRGWVNNNALSIIDLAGRRRLATVLIDEANEGVTDPWGVALGDGGDTLWITAAGVHQLVRIDLRGLHRHLAGDAAVRAASTLHPEMIWPRLWAGKDRLDYHLHQHFTALKSAGLVSRVRLPLNGPRGLAISPTLGTVAVGGYFSGDLVLIDPETLGTLASFSLGVQPPADAQRRGEKYFHDATLSTSHWVSCATCHPEGRADGLNWDLPNDRVGTYKNTKSLVGAHATPPTTWTGVRPNATVSVASGYDHIHFSKPPAQVVADTNTYVAGLRPEPSPYRMRGKLSPLAQAGKVLFESPAVGCASCHSGAWFSNLGQYDVGTRAEADGNDINVPTFDTPSTTEAWRTGPFLHDGRSASLLEVISAHNPANAHGRTSHLTPTEKSALAEYLLSF